MSRLLTKWKIANVGNNVHIRPYVTVTGGKRLSIGNNVVIRPFTNIMAGCPDGKAGIIIEDNVLIGPNVFIAVSRHAYENTNMPVQDQGYKESLSVHIKSGAWLGANSIILPGVVIGRNAVVAAGAVVTKSVDDFFVVGGNPATVIKILQ